MSISLEGICFTYSKDTPFEMPVLKNVDFHADKGTVTGIMGRTGSGKTTLIKILNTLLKPDSGVLKINDNIVDFTKNNRKEFVKKVGIVFQYPDYQLFEETVEHEISFAPKLFGMNEEKVKDLVKKSLKMVGLDYDLFKNRCPFELSGGEKRRVAIASILAMEPEILILDEPTAGLDMPGRDLMLRNIEQLKKTSGVTILIISHRMEVIWELSDFVVILQDGKIVLNGKNPDIFENVELIRSCGLDVPERILLYDMLKNKGYDVKFKEFLTLESTAKKLSEIKKGK